MHHRSMRFSAVAGSVVVNAAVLGLLALLAAPRSEPAPRETAEITVIDVPAPITDVAVGDSGGGGGNSAPAQPAAQAIATRTAAPAPARARAEAAPPVAPPSPWAELDVHVEDAADTTDG